jgi:hypothetical protein
MQYISFEKHAIKDNHGYLINLGNLKNGCYNIFIHENNYDCSEYKIIVYESIIGGRNWNCSGYLWKKDNCCWMKCYKDNPVGIIIVPK